MLVGNWMSERPISIDAGKSLQQTIDIMKKNAIRHLPVTKEGILVGMVSDQDLKRVSVPEATSLEIHELVYLLSKIEVGSIMSKKPISITRDCTLEEAAQIMLVQGISGLPVVNDSNQVVGVITQRDILRVLVSLTGNGRRGIQFAVQLRDSQLTFREIMEIFQARGCILLSVLTTDQNAPAGCINAYIRVQDLDSEQIRDLKETLNKKAQLLYVVDSRDGAREVCRPWKIQPHPSG